jgi:DEAD/DEAH box helicase
MAQPDPSTIALTRGLRERLAAPRLTQGQAKLYSQHVRLRLGQPGLSSFRPAERRERLEEAQILLEAALVEREAADGGNWRHSVKRAGEILEWLAQGEVAQDEYPSALLAAAAYQIAGYPALARGHLAATESDHGTSRVIRLFLEANFPQLLVAANLGIDERVLEPRAGYEAEDGISAAIVTETLRSLAVIASAMRWGDEERLMPAVEKLEALAALSRHSRVAHSGVVAQLCALTAREYLDTNLWPRLRSLSGASGDRASAAYNRFGRKAFAKGKSLIWRSQEVGIERLLAKKSFVLCTPTGSGKTTVAELALIGDLFGRDDLDPEQLAFGDDGPLAIYLVPSRALAAEVERRLQEDLADVGDRRLVVTGLYGGTDWGPTDAWLTSTDPTILVCTYEKAEALLRFLGPVFMRRVRTVIIDEAHSVQFDGRTASLMTADSRALRLETLAIRLFGALKGRPYRLLALSAVTAGLEGSLARWLVGADATPAHSDHRSTRQLVGRLECLPNGAFKIYYDLLDRASLVFPGASEATPYVPSPFLPHPSSPSFVGAGPLARLRPFLAWAAFHLAQRDANGRPHSVLISITSMITAYANSFLKLLEEDWKHVKLPSFFELPREGRALRIWNECLDTAKDYFTEASPEYRLLSHGIVVHHGKMPALLARRLKQVVEEGIVRIVMATSTLSEGVNLPVEYILLPEVHRGNVILSPQEFMNLVGRAGRPGFGTEGRTLVLLPPDPGVSRGRAAASDRRLIDGYRQVVRSVTVSSSAPAPNRASSPLAELLTLLWAEWRKLSIGAPDEDFTAWLESTPVQRPTDGEVPAAIGCLDTLDSILLASLEEMEQLRAASGALEPAEIEAGLRAIWAHSLAKVAAVDEATLSRIFLQRGQAVPALYPDRDERRRLYKTSLPPMSARELLGRLPAIRAHLETGADYAARGSEDRYRFIEAAVELIATVPRFAPAQKVGKAKVDWRSVLRWWLDPSGASKAPNPSQIGLWHEYAANNFAYKTNWALGSVTSLALDAVQEGASPIALSIGEWAKSGLPWIVFWLKELLTWGTLDPVVAFLLARGRAITRMEAGDLARDYYESQAAEPVSNATLDPRRIREWMEGARPTRSDDRRPTRVTSVIPVRLAAAGPAFRYQSLRVLPRKRDAGDIAWMDIAGYHVATSPDLTFQPEWSPEITDFILDASDSTVTASDYL